MRLNLRLNSLLILVVLAWGCSSTHPSLRPVPGASSQPESMSLEEIGWVEENCPAGMPLLEPTWPFGPTATVAREGYALQHSCFDRIALWVCEHVTGEELVGSAVRRNRFAPDPKLEMECRAELSDYRRSGFDRGHMAPAGNQVQSQRLKDETFFLSNMSPQVGSGFNRAIWAKLEGEVRRWIREQGLDDLYVITGGFFYDPEEENPSTADGLIEYETIGSNAVAVPTHFYKIVAGQADDQSWRAVAYVLENRRHPSCSTCDFSPFIRSIDWIEERTQLDFFPELGPVDGPALEQSPGTPFG